MAKSKQVFDVTMTILARSQRVYDDLMKRADGDRDRVKGLAMSYRSWCSRVVGSRKKGAALHRMWTRVAELCVEKPVA